MRVMDSTATDYNPLELVHPVMTAQNVILPPYAMIECHINRQCTRQLGIQKDACRNIQYISANKSTYNGGT